MTHPEFDFSDLTLKARSQLAEDPRDSDHDEREIQSLTEAQAREIHRRLEARRRDEDTGQAWEAVPYRVQVRLTERGE